MVAFFFFFFFCLFFFFNAAQTTKLSDLKQVCPDRFKQDLPTLSKTYPRYTRLAHAKQDLPTLSKAYQCQARLTTLSKTYQRVQLPVQPRDSGRSGLPSQGRGQDSPVQPGQHSQGSAANHVHRRQRGQARRPQRSDHHHRHHLLWQQGACAARNCQCCAGLVTPVPFPYVSVIGLSPSASAC